MLKYTVNYGYMIGITTRLIKSLMGYGVVAVVAGVISIGLLSQPAEAAAPASTPNPQASITPLIQFAADNVNTTATDEEITCVGGALGYITCPLIDISANVILFTSRFLDTIFNFQALSMPELRESWGVFVNLANISMAIGFLVIVMSQATSIGISTYGIKRMLPRMIAAAILINMSFYVCALAIDISNVLGHNMKSFIVSMIPEQNTDTTDDINKSKYCQAANFLTKAVEFGIDRLPNIPFIPDAGDAVAKGTNFGIGVFEAFSGCNIKKIQRGLSGGITIVTVIVAVILIAVFIAFIITIALAIIRYVALIFLVMLAPLAFAAWVLPNTEQYFRKWWNLFIRMLVIYPVAMFLFGGSIFAASVIGNIAEINEGRFIAEMFESSRIGEEGIKAIWAGIQLFIIAMPLFIIPKLFKGLDGITGNLASKLAAMSSRATSAVARAPIKATKAVGKAGLREGRYAALNQAYRNKNKTGLAGSLSRGYIRANSLADRGKLRKAVQEERMRQQAAEQYVRDKSDIFGGDTMLTAAHASAAMDAAMKRQKARETLYTQDGTQFNTMAKQLEDAVATRGGGDDAAATTGAALSQLYKGGATGQAMAKAAIARGVARTGGNMSKDIQNTINRITKENYDTLKSSDFTLTGMADGGKYNPQSLADAGAPVIARQSAHALASNFSQIKQSEAQIIVNNPQAFQNVIGSEAEREIITARANGATVLPSHLARHIKTFDADYNPVRVAHTPTAPPSSGPTPGTTSGPTPGTTSPGGIYIPRPGERK